MQYYIKNIEGEIINTIEATSDFAKKYAQSTGYILELFPLEIETINNPIEEKLKIIEEENILLKNELNELKNTLIELTAIVKRDEKL